VSLGRKCIYGGEIINAKIEKTNESVWNKIERFPRTLIKLLRAGKGTSQEEPLRSCFPIQPRTIPIECDRPAKRGILYLGNITDLETLASSGQVKKKDRSTTLRLCNIE